MTAIAHTAAPDRAPLLRRALQADAVVSFASAAVALAAAGALEPVTGIPAALDQLLGAVFLLYAAGVAYVGTRPTISRAAARAIVGLNFGWVALSVAALALGWLPLTTAGFWVVVAQAVIVDALGVAQLIGLRRSR